MHSQLGALLQQSLDDSNRRRLTNIVGTAFECQAEHAHLLTLQHPHSLVQLPYERFHASQVNVLHFPKQPAVHPVLVTQIHECTKVLGKAVTSEADARVQKLGSNTGIESHA